MTARPAQDYSDVEWYGFRWEFGVVAEHIRGCSGTILEIGCGEGYFARCLPSTANYFGVDFNVKAISAALEHFSTRAGGFYFSTDMPNISEEVQALCMFHVVEHIPRLREKLDDLICTYRPRLIAISVPNPNRLTVMQGVREAWDYPPHHLYRFTHHGVKKLFASLGYMLAHVESEPLGKDELREVLINRFRWKRKWAKRLSSLEEIFPTCLLPRSGQASLFIFRRVWESS
ncbi:MAG: hypothetical protein PHD19_03270 [Dechloromonas sp.]|nr:hypothetical protein [Dechloromonas sp.]